MQELSNLTACEVPRIDLNLVPNNQPSQVFCAPLRNRSTYLGVSAPHADRLWRQRHREQVFMAMGEEIAGEDTDHAVRGLPALDPVDACVVDRRTDLGEAASHLDRGERTLVLVLLHEDRNGVV